MDFLIDALADEVLAEIEAAPEPGPDGRRPFRALGPAFEGGTLTLGGPPGVAVARLALSQFDDARVYFTNPVGATWRRGGSLDDPRCVPKVAAAALGIINEFYREQIWASEATGCPTTLQGVVALKAFLMGFDAIRAGDQANVATTAEEYLELLDADNPDVPRTLIRKMFYALLVATCRPGDQAAERRAARVGLGFGRFHGYSPIFAWRRIVRAVREATNSPPDRLRTGRNAKAAERLRNVARSASRLNPYSLETLDYYFRFITLDDLAVRHGIL